MRKIQIGSVSTRQCAYKCGVSVESPDGYVSGGVPLVRLIGYGKGSLLSECPHNPKHWGCSDKRLALACTHCYNTKTLHGITVANGYGKGE